MPPLRGELDNVPVAISEISLTGVRVIHETRLPATAQHQLRFQWNQFSLHLRCEVARSTIKRLAKKSGETSLYETGLRIMSAIGESDTLLRDLIADFVIRSINEQIANARGIPPLAAYSYQTGKGDRFRRCEYISGSWRKIETTEPDQPSNGFTISGDIDPRDVDLLCRTWELCDAEGKRLTQILAQLSISKKEGIPTRRYEP